MRPHRQQPTRLPRPWDSPGKNTGVGCHFLLQCMQVKSEREVAQLHPTLSDPITAAHQAPPSMGFSSKSTGVGCHCLLLYLSLTITNPLSFHAHTFGEQICTSHFPCCVGTWPSIYTLLPLCTYLLSTTIFFIIVQAYLFTSKMITKFPILICLSN